VDVADKGAGAAADHAQTNWFCAVFGHLFAPLMRVGRRIAATNLLADC
jgi:hypothetical protein